MRKITFILLLAVALMSYSCNDGEMDVEITDSMEHNTDWSSGEILLLDLINTKKNKLLMPNDFLKMASEIRNDFFIDIGRITHNNIADIITLLKGEGFDSIGEVLAFGYTTPQSALNAWVNSETHRDTLLDDKYEYIGISIDENKEGYLYYTVILANKN